MQRQRLVGRFRPCQRLDFTHATPVDRQRLERDIRILSLKDPDAPGDRANLRTRFTVRS